MSVVMSRWIVLLPPIFQVFVQVGVSSKSHARLKLKKMELPVRKFWPDKWSCKLTMVWVVMSIQRLPMLGYRKEASQRAGYW